MVINALLEEALFIFLKKMLTINDTPLEVSEGLHGPFALKASVPLCLSLAVPFCMVHLLEMPLDITGSDIITSYFWVGGPDTTQQPPVRDPGKMGGLF